MKDPTCRFSMWLSKAFRIPRTSSLTDFGKNFKIKRTEELSQLWKKVPPLSILSTTSFENIFMSEMKQLKEHISSEIGRIDARFLKFERKITTVYEIGIMKDLENVLRSRQLWTANEKRSTQRVFRSHARIYRIFSILHRR